MNERLISAEDAISLLAFATRELTQARQPKELIERLASVLTQIYEAESVEVSGPQLGEVRSQARGLCHTLQEGAWLREFRPRAAQRDSLQIRQIAFSAVETARQHLELILELSTLRADLAHSEQVEGREDVETGLRRGLVRSLEWALERSKLLGSAVAVFQIEWTRDLTEKERLEMTAMLRASLRRVDQVVRLNTERVVVILEGLLAPDSVLRVEERLTSRFRAQSLEFWAGVAISPVHAKTPERVLGLAERALHESRALGLRGFYHFGAASGVSWEGESR